jgi:hypothetical protein
MFTKIQSEIKGLFKVEKGVEGYLSDTEVIISIFYICGLLDMVNTMGDPFQNES